MDKRIQKTESLIQDTFIEMALSEGVAGVKITDIATAANVNRSTFYLHYQSIDDILYTLENKAAAVVSEAVRKRGNDLPSVFGDLLDAAAKERKFYSVVLSSRGKRLINKIEAILKKPISRHLMTLKVTGAEQLAYHTRFIVEGMISLVSRWLDNSCKPTKIKMVAIFEDLIN